MKCEIFVFFALASVACAQTKWPNELTVWFPDGSGLEIHTQSTGVNSPLSTSGSINAGSANGSHRMVLDKQGKILFGYDIEAWKAGPGTFTIRIRPLDSKKFSVYSWYPRNKVAEEIPTLAGTRDFPLLRAGDAVEVDILYQPVTGEKIYDVLRVSSGQPPSHTKPTGERFSLEDVRVVVNGKTITEERNTWMIGGGLMIYLPELGEFYFTLSPSPDFPFQASGWVDHNTLRFHAGNELVEVTAKSNVLQKLDYGTVWVYHDPESESRGPATGRSVEFRCGDDVDSLIRMNKQN